MRIYAACMETLTPKEQKLYTFIESYQMENGSSPTVREMKEFMGLKSDGFVVHCVHQLEKKGVIEKGDTARSIKLLPQVAERLHAEVFRIPVLGSIPAGGPVLTDEYIESYVNVENPRIKNPEGVFVLRVTGNSMIEAGIFQDDYVLIDSKKSAREGSIVAALVDGGVTLKRYIKKNGQPYLKAENPEYSDIVPLRSLEVQGVVIGLTRFY